jgi:predicted nucleic acid-binding protein
MPVTVVDASAVAAILLNEPEADALQRRLTACDAAYLWLARHLGAPLVSLDDRLASAAP